MPDTRKHAIYFSRLVTQYHYDRICPARLDAAHDAAYERLSADFLKQLVCSHAGGKTCGKDDRSNAHVPDSGVRRLAGQAETRPQTLLGTVFERDLAAMTFRDGPDQRQAEAEAAGFPAARGIQPYKGFEYA